MRAAGATGQTKSDLQAAAHSSKLLRLADLIAWPPGTAMFALKTWLALAIALYAAFFLQLEGAATAGICVLILAQPTQGMVLSKAIYRTIGTLVGVIAALCISAAFPQDRTMLLAAFAAWIAVQTAIATMLRDFRAYGCVLAGYTVAIVSLANIDAPDATFSAAINRVAAILVGIAAITLANLLLVGDKASQSLMRKLRTASHDVVDMARAAIDQHRRPSPEACMRMAARLIPLRSEISFATPEKPSARARAAGGRSALLGLMEAISAIQAVGTGLDQTKTVSPVVTTALDLTREAIARQNPERSLAALDSMTLQALKTGEIGLADAHILDRLRFLIATMAHVRDGLRAMRSGLWPARRVSLPLHQDYFAVVLNATRVIVAIAFVAALSVWSGIPETSAALLFTAVFVSLGSLQPNPAAMGNAGLFGMPIVIILSTLYAFYIFPNITGYPLFIVSLAPLALAMCWLIMRGQPGYGLIIGVQTLAEIAPNNVQTLDPESFVATITMLAPAGLAIFMAFRLVLPVQPAQRRLRLALSMGQSLRNALADKQARAQPRASLYYDRLSQFRSWQIGETTTLARHKTMTRLADIGLLAHAVRRSWRALDHARPFVSPKLDARARHILPTLSPQETDRVASDYLASAAQHEGPAALALIHAAAALHGTALATGTEMRLLRRVALVHQAV